MLIYLLKKLHSHVSQTAIMVIFIVFVSVWLTIWLFWRSLYLPELQNHASYLAREIDLMREANNAPTLKTWLVQHPHLAVEQDPHNFPDVADKMLADFFTETLRAETEKELGRPIQLYFKFKPIPVLWIYDKQQPDIWLKEPVAHYSQYSPYVLAAFILGLPLLTLIIIVFLVRALNRPLKRLQAQAMRYILTGDASPLPIKGPSEIRAANAAFNQLFFTIDQAQKERTLMLAGISHDLRTPLTRIRLTAELLPDEFLKEGLIYDVEDMDAILEQFISFMKDGSDEEPAPTNLDTICHEIIVQFSDVDFIYDGTHEWFNVRPLSIKRLLVNLVNNAIRYGKPPIHLIIKTLKQNDATWLLLCVKDEGAGVDEAELTRIMQPFERGEIARTIGGSGLGLAIVERIARLHLGHVQALNHPEGGLQVCVYIPLENNETGSSADL